MQNGSDVGVLLLQLGTPAAPTAASVRTYLAEFLKDRRVIDLNRALWLPILYLGVLPSRPAKSARLYQKIWTPEGSPLAVISDSQARKLAAELSPDGAHRVPVRVAMRYGEPSIAQALDALLDSGIRRILAFPMYPQYAGATTGSSLERLLAIAGTKRVVPSIRVVPPYAADPLYIRALAAVCGEVIDAQPDPPDCLLLSYHGLPARYAEEGDPYPAECRATTASLATALGLTDARVRMTYQSRFGREVWLQPYTDATLVELGRAGARIVVACPGFTADCLETLEEIAMSGRKTFLDAGGASFGMIPCLNDHPAWISAMAAIARRELQGWL